MTAENFEFIQLSSLEKVFLDERPEGGELTSLSALANERASYQIAFCYHGEPVSDVNVFDFNVSISSPIEKHVKIGRVGNVPVALSHYDYASDDGCIRKRPGLYPDPVFPMKGDALHVTKQLWNSVWITVDPKGEVPPGIYDVNIVFSYRDVKIVKTMKLKLLSASLPEQETVVANWFHTDCLAKVYGVKMYSERHWQIIDRFMKCAIDNGVNSIYTPLFSIPLDTDPGMKRPACQLVDITVDDGEYYLSFEKLRRWIGIFKKHGGAYLELSHLFSQWGANFAPRIVAKVNGRQRDIFGWHTPATSPEYRRFLEKCLPEVVCILREEGVAEKALFHISDEPHLKRLPSYMSAKNVVLDLLDGFTIIETCSDPEAYESGAVSYPIVHLPAVDAYLEKGITPYGAYFCCSTSLDDHCNRFIDMPSYRNRSLGMILYKYDVKCLLHFGFNYYFRRCIEGGTADVVNPFLATDAGSAIPGGNGFVVYPGENGTPIPSLRLLVTYDALQDIRAMRLLEGYIGHDAVVKIIEDCAGHEIKTNLYPKTSTFLLALREKINQRIEDVTK